VLVLNMSGESLLENYKTISQWEAWGKFPSGMDGCESLQVERESEPFIYEQKLRSFKIMLQIIYIKVACNSVIQRIRPSYMQ